MQISGRELQMTSATTVILMYFEVRFENRTMTRVGLYIGCLSYTSFSIPSVHRVTPGRANL